MPVTAVSSLSLTASIGFVSLVPALRQKKNHKKTVTCRVFNREASGCRYCSDSPDGLPDPDSGICRDCPCQVYDTKTKTVYVNEKSRYGKKLPLRKNALLLYMYMHFLFPNRDGLVCIDPEDAAEYLHCSERTVINNLRLLEQREYIALSRYGYRYMAFILDYKSYFLPADQGGRGYSVFTTEMLDTLIMMDTITEIRISMRSVLACVDSGINGKTVCEQDYADFKLSLPAYCSTRTIRQALSGDNFRTLFNSRLKKHSAVIGLRQNFDPFHVRRKYQEDCMAAVRKLVDDINTGKPGGKKKRILYLSETDLKDISQIALRYPSSTVVSAVRQYYEEYIVHNQNQKVRSVGALVRTIADNISGSLAFA